MHFSVLGAKQPRIEQANIKYIGFEIFCFCPVSRVHVDSNPVSAVIACLLEAATSGLHRHLGDIKLKIQLPKPDKMSNCNFKYNQKREFKRQKKKNSTPCFSARFCLSGHKIVIIQSSGH